MAILGIEGFDHFTTAENTHLEITETENYNYIGLGLDIRTSETPFGEGKAIHIDDESRELRFTNAGAYTADDTIFVGFHINPFASGSYAKFIASFFGTGSVYQAVVKLNTDGTVEARRGNGSTLVGSPSTATIPFNSWSWVEVKAVISDTGSIEVRLNGVEILNVSGDFKASVTSEAIDTWAISSGNSTSTYYDNCVWQDGSGAWLGECKIETFMPAADSSITWSRSAGTTNYENVDEIGPSDADYVYSSTVDQVDLYDVGALGADDTVHAVQVSARASKSLTGARQIETRTKSSTNEQGGLDRALGASWQWFPDVFETTDGGTTPWTKTLFDAAQFGIKLTV